MEQYKVIRSIGKGSFGKVYLVKHVDEGRHFVMKVIKLKGIPPKERFVSRRRRIAAAMVVSRARAATPRREACRNEVMLMQRMQHPNIVAYRESFFANGRDNLCIVMTYCDGGDLAARVTAAKATLFKEDLIMHWFVQMALAVAYMHDNKVLHRDIKTQVRSPSRAQPQAHSRGLRLSHVCPCLRRRTSSCWGMGAWCWVTSASARRWMAPWPSLRRR